ncbi:STAS domain-containing protein [Actinoplanes sp. NPDC051346]|uniref:STAS domain-containing protein n=1 Tax=Actinoplanes sp. NPDC051346 TaxID=3155048 RepID=UPI0034144ABB
MDRQSEVMAGCEMVWSAGKFAASGEIDAGNAAGVGERIHALVGEPVVTVDCTALTFLDAAGMRMLLRAGAAAAAMDTILHLRCSPAVTETFHLCEVWEAPGLVIEYGTVMDRDHSDRPRSSE